MALLLVVMAYGLACFGFTLTVELQMSRCSVVFAAIIAFTLFCIFVVHGG